MIRSALDFRATFERAKAESGAVGFDWYPYDCFTNLYPIDRLLHGRSLVDLAGGEPVLDVGCADGALAFFLESLGCKVQAIDYSGTNMNQMRGVRLLKEALGSSVEIHDMDVDARFCLPQSRYGLVLFLGTLYHLKNPFHVLEGLSRASRNCLLSTRIASWTPAKDLDYGRFPMAYLVDPFETNNDSTNYWIFSEVGLRRLLQRTGWRVCDLIVTGAISHCDPVHSDDDARAFCLLESVHQEPPAPG